jgi:hypothetical protein
MTENLPDYETIEPTEDAPRAEYSTHERRADLWRLMKQAGSPTRLNKARLSRKYDVSRKTIYRDFERLQEWAADSLGEDAKLTTRAVFESVLEDLLDAEEWRAKREAFDVMMEWNEWLADLGEQHREPDKSELDVDLEARTAEVAYTVVREGSVEDLPTDDEGGVDYDDLGFTKAPTTIDLKDARGEADR